MSLNRPSDNSQPGTHRAARSNGVAVRGHVAGEGIIDEGDMGRAINALAAIGTVHKLHAGETLLVEGDPAAKCYEVVSGLLKEFNTLKDGSCHVSDFRYPGDLVGLTRAGAYSHSVEAVEQTLLRSYPIHSFRTIMARSPALSEWLEERLLSDLERTRSNALALSRLTAMERVARFLLTLSRMTGPRNDLGGAFAIPMNRQDVADHLGLTIETVCRSLTTLRRNGLIVMATPHGFTISDEAALRALADREDPNMAGLAER